MDATQNWNLLSSVVQDVLEVAQFYTGKDPEATAARAEIDRREDCKDSFYADLFVELQSLADYVLAYDEAVELPNNAISRVLEMLDNRCCITPRDKVKVSSTHRKEIQN
jgi:hypothetical protein